MAEIYLIFGGLTLNNQPLLIERKMNKIMKAKHSSKVSRV